MADNQTIRTGAAVDAFLAALEPPERRADAQALAAAMTSVTREPPAMWGPSIVGYGSVHYRYNSGREGDMPALSFSPRKNQLVLYGVGGAERHPDLLAGLGKHSTGKGCVNIKRMADIDPAALDTLLTAAWAARSGAV